MTTPESDRPEDEAAGQWAAVERIIRANQYMTLATADGNGLPWSSPVWFATADCVELFWVSAPGTRHSRNIAARPELAISIFDSQQPPGTGAGVYLSATGVLVPDSGIDAGIAIFGECSERVGLPPWARPNVEAPAKHRLYRASVREHFVLDAHDERTAVSQR